jgi:transcriptional regulator with XRE-family HTH domain
MRNDLYSFIGQRIRDLRKARGGVGLSQEELAKFLKKSTNTVSRWETGAYRPSANDLQRLAKFFGVAVGSFFPDEETESPQMQALLRAADGLGKKDLEDLAEYARFRRARQKLESGADNHRGDK